MLRTTPAPRPNRLKEIRRKRKLTAFQLGNAVGVRETTIYRYESGDLLPRLDVMQALAMALDSTLDELFPAGREPKAASA